MRTLPAFVTAPHRVLVPAALVAWLLAACGGSGGDPTPPADTFAPDAGPTDVASPDVGAGCTTLGPLVGPLNGERTAPGLYQVGLGDADLGLGGGQPDIVTVEFYGPDGYLSELQPGTYDLGSDANANYATCLQCVLVWVDVEGDMAAGRLLNTGGTLSVSVAADTGAVTVTLQDLTLAEVDIDEATYASTLVDDGLCATVPGAQAVACAPLCQGRVCGSDNCGGSCGACPGGQDCRQDGSQCDAPPDPASQWTLTLGSGTVVGDGWDNGGSAFLPADPAVCLELAPDDWQCSSEQSNTSAPVWNWSFGTFSAQALMTGLPFEYLDIDDALLFGGDHDPICPPGLLQLGAEHFISGTRTVECATGSFTVGVSP